MKKKVFYHFIFFPLLTVFFLLPSSCLAADFSFQYYTSIENWNGNDPLYYHCPSLSAMSFQLEVEDSNGKRLLDGCEDSNDLDLTEKGIDTSDDSFRVYETYTYENNTDIPSEFDIIHGSFFSDDSLGEIPVTFYIFRDFQKRNVVVYHDEETNLFSVVEKDTGLPLDSSEPCSLGAVHFPVYAVRYHFKARGDLANTNGYFDFRDPYFSIETKEFHHGDIFVIASNYSEDFYYHEILLSDLKQLVEHNEVSYHYYVNSIDNSNNPNIIDSIEAGYTLSFTNLNGNDLSSIVQLSETVFGLDYEIEARLDSSLADTGLLYDIWPFILLGILLLSFMFFFFKNRIREETVEEEKDEIL